MFELPIKYITGDNLSYHCISMIKHYVNQSEYLIAVVDSYKYEIDYLNGDKPVTSDKVSIPVSALGPNIGRSLELWLVQTDVGGKYYGGDLKLAPSTDPLIYAQDKRWAYIESIRDIKLSEIDLNLSETEVVNAVKAIRTKARDIKTLIYAATTIEAVETINWDSIP